MKTLERFSKQTPTIPMATVWLLKELYTEFERRVGDVASPKGEKAEMVLAGMC